MSNRPVSTEYLFYYKLFPKYGLIKLEQSPYTIPELKEEFAHKFDFSILNNILNSFVSALPSPEWIPELASIQTYYETGVTFRHDGILWRGTIRANVHLKETKVVKYIQITLPNDGFLYPPLSSLSTRHAPNGCRQSRHRTFDVNHKLLANCEHAKLSECISLANTYIAVSNTRVWYSSQQESLDVQCIDSQGNLFSISFHYGYPEDFFDDLWDSSSEEADDS